MLSRKTSGPGGGGWKLLGGCLLFYGQDLPRHPSGEREKETHYFINMTEKKKKKKRKRNRNAQFYLIFFFFFFQNKVKKKKKKKTKI